jgi:hypothetical protein
VDPRLEEHAGLCGESEGGGTFGVIQSSRKSYAPAGPGDQRKENMTSKRIPAIVSGPGLTHSALVLLRL